MLSSFTVFSLVAPMGSFGGPAGHERRGSNSWPGRSAVLGLIGAALGVRRTDKEGQEKYLKTNPAEILARNRLFKPPQIGGQSSPDWRTCCFKV